MIRGLTLTVLLMSGAVLATDDAALRELASCREKLDVRTDAGIERIQRRCPELLPALAVAPWRELLPRNLRERREEMTAESLRALEELVRHANVSDAMRSAPDRAVLTPVLAELGDLGQQGATRWERFKRWLQEKLETRKDKDEDGWLEKWSRQFSTSEGVAQAITYLGYALVAVLVLYVIWAELRAAGLLSGRPRSARTNAAAEWRRRLMLADVTAAPLAERPGMLLRLLGEALARAHRLPAADGLTATAIAQRARLDEDAEREQLRGIAAAADSVRYGESLPPPEALEGVVNSARELLAKFARPAAGKR